MIWFVLLIVAALGAAPAYGERWLVPDALPDGSIPDAIAIGDDDATLDYYRIDAACALTLEGPGILRFTICGPADTETDVPETLRVAIDGLAGYPPQPWTEVVAPSKRTAFAASPDARVTEPRELTFGIPRGVQHIRVTGASVWGGPVYAHFVYDGPPSAQDEQARAFDPLTPDLTRPGWPSEPVGLAGIEDSRAYYRIDQGCPIRVTGPGLLRLFARAHAQPGRPEPQQLTVSITGLPGFGEQRWVDALRTASALRFADGRSGFPTDARKVVLRVPEGVHDLLVTGTTDGADPVYATLGFQLPAPPPEPVVKATPKPKPPRKPRSPWRVTGDLALETIYDDNIARFSESTLAELKSGVCPECYGIETVDDLIVHQVVQTELSHARLLLGRSTRLRVRYQRWEYMRNGIKTNDEFNIRARQYTRRSDYVEAGYTYAPNGYVKELTDRPPFVSRVVPREYEHFVVTRNDFDLGYRWGALSWLAMRGGVGRTLRFYNQRFMENDIWEWSGGLAADVSIGRFGIRPEYQYVSAKARGYDQVGETLSTSDNDGDGSSEKDTYKLRIAYQTGDAPYRPPPVGSGALAGLVGALRAAGAWIDRGLMAAHTAACEVQFAYGRQFYTSKKPLHVDPGHVGRLDQSKQVQIGWSSTPVYKQASFEAGARYTVRTAKAPAGLIGENDPSEEKDFTGTRYWVAVNLPMW
jgi:hypothetical protein